MNNNVKILIADDEERWRRLVGDFLRNEGYQIIEAANGQEAVDLIRSDSDISLAILDIMMPVMDGIRACQIIREFSQLPIIMLTAKNDEDSEVMGFVCGADEYIAKPIKFPVFMARVRALLKRSVSVRSTVEVAGICIDPDAHTVTVDGKEIALTPREFELLLYVAQNKNIALSRQQILSAVWNFDYYGDARTVDTHVKNLRMKLGEHGSALKTVRGRGYKLEG
ncbi:MAG: response regulator transcription factor [Oscillospiraceae bacterium]|nr:response regulator transcription factor [Oscillospiraceae bacterium]